MAKKQTNKVDAIKHTAQTRPNNPSIEMESIVPDQPQPVSYTRNRDLDPQLYWTGKDEENDTDLHIDAVPIYVQEKIHPQVLVNDLKQQTAQKRSEQPGATPDMFASDFNGLTDEAARVEFYQHRQKWTNRLILGDSLMVMASLAHKEGLKGQVQCIYMDPPYGIKFGSNWQTSTKSTSVTDKDETQEPEMIQAFRDTWKLGIHSYLSYLRDRLTVARDLLTESGSIFLQIGDENVHSAATLMDEVFGAENRVATISYASAASSSTNQLPQVTNYLLWYAKNKDQVKYRQLYEELDRKEIVDFFTWHVHLELADGNTRKLTDEEFLFPDKYVPQGAYLFRRTPFDSQGVSVTGRSEPYTWRNREYRCGVNRQWSVSKEGMDRIDKAGRLHAVSGQDSLAWKRYEYEVPGRRINNLWSAKMHPSDKSYVVQTANKVIKRCILMTTDPGDLVLDPTCGGATTATVAEQWGRRWITIDTSRVALAIARARLMGNKYDHYLMQDSEEGAKKEQQLSGKPDTKTQYAGDIRHGFVYERVNTVSPKSFADNLEIDEIWQRWQEKLQPLREELNKILGTDYEEWEIPTEPESDWSKAAKETYAQWLAAKKQRQQQIDASIAANANTEYLVDRPYTARNAVRVTGPFTVESLSPHRVLPTEDRDESLLQSAAAEAEQAGESAPQPESRRLRARSQTENEASFMKVIYDNLKVAGVQNTRKNERLMFSEIEPWQGSQLIQFCGHYEENGKNKKAAICVGPEYGTVSRSYLAHAAREAGDWFDIVLVLGFAFEAYADARMMNIGKMEVLKIRLNIDLHMGDRLRETGNSNLFVVFGEPDIEARELENDMWEVEIKGVDIFDPTTGKPKPSDTKDIACWMIDTNYNEESFFARHIYFTGGGKDPYKQLKRALNSDIDKEAWDSLYQVTSRPFPSPKTGKIAVKAINHYGDEVIKVFTIPT